MTAGAPVATVLLAITMVASVLALTAMPSWMVRGVFRPASFLPQRHWATPLTSAFLHADWAHLAFNLFTFWAFAFQLERQIGGPRFALLYVAGIAASQWGTWIQHRHQPGYSTLGASGAISAVLFASIVYFPTASLVVFPIPVPLPAPVFAVAYLVFTWYSARQRSGRINHDAHLGGALAGLAFVALTDAPAYGRALRSVFGS